MILGTDPDETKTVAFTQWIAPGRATLIHVDPHKTFTSNYAEANGGVPLQVNPATDAWAIMAIARVILENGWQAQSSSTITFFSPALKWKPNRHGGGRALGAPGMSFRTRS